MGNARWTLFSLIKMSFPRLISIKNEFEYICSLLIHFTLYKEPETFKSQVLYRNNPIPCYALIITIYGDDDMSIPIIIDTDPGIDDATAISIALSHPQFDVKMISTVNGNVGIEKTTANALKLKKFLIVLFLYIEAHPNH